MTDGEAQQSRRAESRFFYGYVIIAAAFFILVVTWGTNYSFGVFFTPLLTEFNWSSSSWMAI